MCGTVFLAVLKIFARSNFTKIMIMVVLMMVMTSLHSTVNYFGKIGTMWYASHLLASSVWHGIQM